MLLMSLDVLLSDRSRSHRECFCHELSMLGYERGDCIEPSICPESRTASFFQADVDQGLGAEAEQRLGEHAAWKQATLLVAGQSEPKETMKFKP